MKQVFINDNPSAVRWIFPREGAGSLTAGSSVVNLAQDFTQNSQCNFTFCFGTIAFANEDILEDNFRSCVKKWREEIGAESSLSKITGNINYLKIIKLGIRAVPLILKELQSEPAPWFLALRVLTDDSEVGRSTPGDFKKMSEEWILWGKERGYIT
ncbi:MAG: hypothetical protein LV479_01485 [Methylacidiphilales bacterium]|nr:hypothetical protein [Candidatus Methylacidiphilales bacterium]